MHCLIWSLATAAVLSLSSAANVRPINSVTPRDYQEQDTARAFYSYGYSDENAARAEYTARDGSSRGFYSYVDANGQLQTVKYEAGGRQGFKAEASNQPKPPIDDRKPPLPVTDTLEVQQARQAHLNALEEARSAEKNNNRQDIDERQLTDEDAAILERVRQELSSMLAGRQRDESRNSAEQTEKQDAQQQQAEEREEAEERERERVRARAQQQELDREQEQQQQQQERLQDAKDANELRLRTVYTLADISSSSYLKLSDLEDRLDRNSQDLRIPIGAYYSYSSPNAKYSVSTPTELRTLRPVALSRSVLLSKQN